MITIKPRARFTPHLGTWAFWMPPDGWATRMVGFGYSLEQACEDWLSKVWERREKEIAK